MFGSFHTSTRICLLSPHCSYWHRKKVISPYAMSWQQKEHLEVFCLSGSQVSTKISNTKSICEPIANMWREIRVSRSEKRFQILTKRTIAYGSTATIQSQAKNLVFSKSKIQHKLGSHWDASVSFSQSSLEQLRIIHLTLADFIF